MTEDRLKHIWNLINDPTEILGSSGHTRDSLIRSRSGSVQEKVRILFRNDLILKTVGTLAFLADLLLYRDNQGVIFICLGGLFLQAIMFTLEVNLLHQFKKASDYSRSTRDSLSGLVTFLKRKSPLFGITIAASQITFFSSGVLLYYYLVYGQVKSMTLLTFFVFSVLLGIWTISSYLRIQSQTKFHINNLTAFLGDLNENTLEVVFNAIEKERKQDELIKVLVSLLLIFGFVALLAVLKSVLA